MGEAEVAGEQVAPEFRKRECVECEALNTRSKLHGASAITVPRSLWLGERVGNAAIAGAAAITFALEDCSGSLLWPQMC